MLENLVNNKENYKGTGSNDLQWYSKIQTDGSQIWVIVRENIIQNGGINNPPRPWDPITGYNAPRRKFYIMDNSYEKRAYMSLFYIVDRFYWEEENDSIAVVASDMSPFTFRDGNSADPATYGDFIKSLNACYAQTNKEDVFTAHKASIKFLEMYRDEFGFEIDEYIKKLTFDMYEKEFKSLDIDVNTRFLSDIKPKN